MIRHTYRRPPGGRRYSADDRAAARKLYASGAAPTVTPEALAAMTSADGIEPVVDVLFELESNRLSRPTATVMTRDGIVVAPAAGSVTSLIDGKRAGPPVTFGDGITVATLSTSKVAVLSSWTAYARKFNAVEVSSPLDTPVTAIRVYYLPAPFFPWVEVATATGDGGRVVAHFPEVTAYGVEVQILDVDAPDSAPVRVIETDYMFLTDVSDDVVELTVEWSRETDPGSAADPVGNFETASCSLTVDNTSGAWNPGTNARLDVGHRIEVAFGVAYYDEAADEWVEELFPGGVYYSDPFDEDSDATEVSITGLDRLGRNADNALAEPVAVGATVGTVVTALAAKYLDLDASQVAIDPTIAAVTFPYLYPSGNLGSYLADLAKATVSTIHVDALDRLVMARRATSGEDVVAEITDTTSLLRYKRPPGFDSTTSIVTVDASPLALGAVADLWAMPSGGLTIAASTSYVLIAQYDTAPAVNGFVSGVVADGSYTITAAAYYADRAELTIRNNETRTLVVADLRVRGNPLEEKTLTARAEHAPSITRYGPRELKVDARLAQTRAQVELIAAVLLESFRSLDDDGIRRLPDLVLDALGLLHLEAGDRVIVSYPEKGIGGTYTILGRRLTYSGGALLSNDVRVRETPVDVVFGVTDRGLLTDDGVVVGY